MKSQLFVQLSALINILHEIFTQDRHIIRNPPTPVTGISLIMAEVVSIISTAKGRLP